MPLNWVTIWLDRTYETAVATINTEIHLSLCKVDPFLMTFRDFVKCVDYMKNLKEDESRVNLIISNDTAPLSPETFLQRIEEHSLIHSIYLLILNTTHRQTYEMSPKVHGIYTDLKSLCTQLYQLPYLREKRRKGLLRTDFNITSISSVTDPSSSNAITTTATSQLPPLLSAETTRRQEAEFMYAQLLRDILIEIESGEEEIIEFCRQKYANNQTELNVIEEFKDYYDPCNAIFWYTRDTFLYGLLNKAWREQDIDILYSLRYFIKDLHLQLKERHMSQQQQTSSEATNTTADTVDPLIETVYRGQLMNNVEFDK